MAAAVSDFAQKQHIDMFAADPGLPELKLPETEPELVEKILDMDEATFRKIFKKPKPTADLQREGAQETNDMD